MLRVNGFRVKGSLISGLVVFLGDSGLQDLEGDWDRRLWRVEGQRV